MSETVPVVRGGRLLRAETTLRRWGLIITPALIWLVRKALTKGEGRGAGGE